MPVNWIKRIIGRGQEHRSMRTFDYWGNRYVAAETGGYTNPDAASGHAVALRAIQIIAENLSMVPLRLYRSTDDGGRAPATANPLYGVLHDSFTDLLPAFEAREFLIASVLVHGNAYARIERNERGQIVALHPYAPPLVAVERRPSGRIRYVAHPPEGGTDILLDGEMLHIRYRLAADGLRGLSPIDLARATFSTALSQQRQAESQAANAFRPAGMLSFPKPLAKDAMEKAQTTFRDRVIGASKANEIVVVDGGLEWKPFTLPAKDMEFLESRKLSNLDVARVFGVPPTSLGIMDNASYSNAEQESRALVVRCLAPMAKRIEAAMTNALLTPDARRGLVIEHDLQGLLRGDMEGRYKAYATGRQWGFLSPNEIRRFENLPAIENGDTYMAPVNMAPLGTEPEVKAQAA